jgi:dolichol-phosphate mannosyltransferase
MPKDSGTFGLIDREVAGHLLRLTERAFFFPGLRCWLGFRQAVVEYERAERAGGRAKQDLGRLLNYAWDALTSFSEAPLRLIAGTGFVLSTLGGLYAMGLVAIRVGQFFGAFKSVEVLGFTTIAVAVFTLAGVQLFCLGVVGQYLAKVYVEVKRRPLFIVEWAGASETHGTERA